MSRWAPVHTFYAACGTGGAMVNITPKVLTDQGGVTRTVGRESPFDDFAGGSFAFTLDNRDGRFTPDTPNAGATPLTEGMVVAWQTDSRLVSGRIGVSGLALIFPDPGSAESARIRVTVADAVSIAGRHNFPAQLAESMISASNPYLHWPLTDPAGFLGATEATGHVNVFASRRLGAGDFGADGMPGVSGTQLMFSPTSSSSGISLGDGVNPRPVVPYTGQTTSTVVQSFWLTVGRQAIDSSFIQPNGLGNNAIVGFQDGRVNLSYTFPLAGPTVTGPQVTSTPMFIEVVTTETVAPPTGANTRTIADELFVNGMSYGSISTSTSGTNLLANRLSNLYSLNIILEVWPSTLSIAQVAYTPVRIREQYATLASEAARLQAIVDATPDTTLGTLPAGLAPALLAPNDVTGQSSRDALNDVIRTEQGQLYATTTGAVTAPVETLQVRARDRPATPSVTWTAAVDVQGDATIIRDLSYTVSQVTATTPVTSAVFNDSDMAEKVGSANTSISTLFEATSDAYTAASDRLNRGRKKGFDVPKYTVQGISASTNRSADLLALTPGDRHRIDGLPVTQMGVASWDGWLCGWSEYWDAANATFTLNFETCTKRTAVYDTNRYMAGGDLSLSSSLTASAATMNVATVGAKLSTIACPYDMLLDSEIVTVTACTSATPQVATITRGIAGTSAATHSAGLLIDLATESVYAY